MDERMMETREPEGEAREAREAGEAARGDGALASGSMSLDEDGVLKFSDDFFDDDFGPAPDAKDEEPDARAPESVRQTGQTERTGQTEIKAGAAFYTPQEMAAAFRSGSVDTERLRPDVRDYYTEIMKDVQAGQRQESEPLRPDVPPMPPVMLPQPVDIGKLRDAGRKVAAQLYLKIPEGDFDEFNPEHQQAQQIAMMEIRDRALEMSRQHAAQMRAAHEAKARAERLVGDYRRTYDDFARENADLDMRAFDAYYADWRSGLTVRDATEVDAAIRSGDTGKVRMVMSRMANDFRKTKGDGGGVRVKTQAPAKPAGAPPKVEGSGGGFAKEEGGVMDVSTLGEMSLDEQADLLLKLKIV